jgi:hypothetical protein
MQNPVFADILDQDGKVRKDRHAADYSMEEVVPSEALMSIAVFLKSRHEKRTGLTIGEQSLGRLGKTLSYYPHKSH